MRKIGRLLCTLIVVFFCALAVIQEDPWLKTRVEKSVNVLFGQMYECGFSSHVSSISLIRGYFELTDLVAINPDQQDWFWNAKRATISWSWLDLIRYGSCGLHLVVEGVSCSSRCSFLEEEPLCAMYSHIALLTAPAILDIPFNLASFAIRNGTIGLQGEGYTFGCTFASDSQLSSDAFRSTLYLSSGYMAKDDVPIIQDFGGKGTCYFPYYKECSEQYELHATGKFAQLPEDAQDITFDIQWKSGNSTCTLVNDEQTLDAKFTVHDYDHMAGLLQIPAVYLFSLFSVEKHPDIKGDAFLSCSADYTQFASTFSAQLVGKDLAYYGSQLPDCVVTAKKNPEGFAGDVMITGSTGAHVVGDWSFDVDASYLKTEFSSNSIITLPGPWDLQKFKASLYGDIFRIYNVSGDFDAVFVDRITKKTYAAHGSCNGTIEHVLVDGEFANREFEVVLGCKPRLYCEQIKYVRHDMTLLDVRGGHTGDFEGVIDYSLLRGIIKLTGNDLPGEGIMQITGSCVEKKFNAHFSMPQTSIRIPWTYSVVQAISGDITGDLIERKIQFNNIKAQLYKGLVTSSQTVFWFDEYGHLAFFHSPLVLHSCFLSWKKDLFAQISGALVSRYTPDDGAFLEGQLVLDQSHMRGNVLSAEFQHEFLGQGSNSLVSHIQNQISGGQSGDCKLDLALVTKSPLEVKTPFLDASAQCALSIGGSMSDVSLSGSIELLNGVLVFPYKPLFIERGTITFLPNRPYDPVIELLARNTIKKYAIELALTGSALAPQILFSSSPQLAREQIITLLLGGSEDGSLYLIMPKMITDTLEHLMFGSAATSSRVQKYLRSLLRPFKNIRIVPSFGDQTGRGGVRGSVAVEVNERLRAVIEKNFSLPEDTTYEVEYLVSDDTSMRLVKDERGDVGGEVEMRWKF